MRLPAWSLVPEVADDHVVFAVTINVSHTDPLRAKQGVDDLFLEMEVLRWLRGAQGREVGHQVDELLFVEIAHEVCGHQRGVLLFYLEHFRDRVAAYDCVRGLDSK